MLCVYRGNKESRLMNEMRIQFHASKFRKGAWITAKARQANSHHLPVSNLLLHVFAQTDTSSWVASYLHTQLHSLAHLYTRFNPYFGYTQYCLYYYAHQSSD